MTYNQNGRYRYTQGDFISSMWTPWAPSCSIFSPLALILAGQETPHAHGPTLHVEEEILQPLGRQKGGRQGQKNTIGRERTLRIPLWPSLVSLARGQVPQIKRSKWPSITICKYHWKSQDFRLGRFIWYTTYGDMQIHIRSFYFLLVGPPKLHLYSIFSLLALFLVREIHFMAKAPELFWTMTFPGLLGDWRERKQDK